MTHSKAVLARAALAKAVLALSFAAAITALCASAPFESASAAPAGPSAAAPAPVNAPPSAGVIAMGRGIEAFKQGKLANAIGALSSSISKGGLSSGELARALYYRGLAYRKQGKPSQAIPDLTNAVWLGDGLDASERADAIANRAAAYREAGIPDPGGIPAAHAAAAPAAGAVQAVVAAPASSSQGTHTTTATVPQPSSSGIGAIGGFFNNLFGGSSTPEPSGAKELTTASTVANAAVTAAPSAVSSWTNATEVTAKTAAPVRVAAIEPKAKAQPPAPATAGKYKLQVAIVRSRDEADRLIAAILAKHGAKLKSYTTRAEETVLGNMGTFYRVNVAPFANAEAPQRLCKSLVADGYDCMVVTN